jgi:streptogramin lyase
LARGPAGTIYVADTHHVFEVTVAGGPGSSGAVARATRLKGRLLGSFSAGSKDALWLGGYRREGDSETRLYRIPFAALDAPEIDETKATASLPLPDRAQGAAFAPDGRLWITRSGSKFGELLRLDPKTGAIEARYDMPAGIEDISFAPDGRLWSVVEAGSRRWNSWTTFFPLVFEIDVARLR